MQEKLIVLPGKIAGIAWNRTGIAGIGKPRSRGRLRSSVFVLARD
ncbi:MAG TPA: hypothetical protein VKH81_05990 [Candidatus Angelobacter sp.]|nr:hypothetical protein [Candidatus Angelobacter sp.]